MNSQDAIMIGLLLEEVWVNMRGMNILQEGWKKSKDTPIIHNRVIDLPDDAPYGFWIDRHGNFAVVNTSMGHYNVGNRIINSLDTKKNTGGYGGVYTTLFNLGWIRVVSVYEDIMWENDRAGYTLSQEQSKLLKFMLEFYNKGEVVEK